MDIVDPKGEFLIPKDRFPVSRESGLRHKWPDLRRILASNCHNSDKTHNLKLIRPILDDHKPDFDPLGAEILPQPSHADLLRSMDFAGSVLRFCCFHVGGENCLNG